MTTTFHVSHVLNNKYQKSEKNLSEKKKCSRCKGSFKKSNFHKNNQTKDGLEYYCKVCKRIVNGEKNKDIPAKFDGVPLLKTYKEGRSCKKRGCKTKLSIYNPSRYCMVHHSENIYKG